MKALCPCNVLRVWASEDGTPVVFDKSLKEFRLTCQNGFKIFRYCPVCGSRLPKSRRPTVDRIRLKEGARIRRLLTGLKTRADLIERFGPPQKEGVTGMSVEAYDPSGRLRSVSRYKSLIYSSISKVSDVTFYVSRNHDGIAFMLDLK